MTSIPFNQTLQLIDKLEGTKTASHPETQTSIPNEPFVLNTDTKAVADFLNKELACPVIDELLPHMHFVARKSGVHIDPLHEHLLKGRTVKITENPGLHLVWYYKELYVKPLPQCLFSYGFWEKHLTEQEQSSNKSSKRRAALGFVRSYAYLIRHESDFRIAQGSHLVPQEISYFDFQNYVEHFRDSLDDAVSPRWHFGQLRLTRLNWAVRLLQPSSRKGKGILQRLFYQELYWQTGQVLDEFGAPLLFLFATLSLILSAMQVILAGRSQDPWVVFVNVSWGFSVAVIVLLAVVFFSMALIVTLILFSQLGFAWREARKPRRPSQD
jgi:hypothetical protein